MPFPGLEKDGGICDFTPSPVGKRRSHSAGGTKWGGGGAALAVVLRSQGRSGCLEPYLSAHEAALAAVLERARLRSLAALPNLSPPVSPTSRRQSPRRLAAHLRFCLSDPVAPAARTEPAPRLGTSRPSSSGTARSSSTFNRWLSTSSRHASGSKAASAPVGRRTRCHLLLHLRGRATLYNPCGTKV